MQEYCAIVLKLPQTRGSSYICYIVSAFAAEYFHTNLYQLFIFPNVFFISVHPLMYSAFAIELSDLSKPFKFARLKGFERLENCLTKGTYERFWKVKQLSEQTYLYHRVIP